MSSDTLLSLGLNPPNPKSHARFLKQNMVNSKLFPFYAITQSVKMCGHKPYKYHYQF